MRTSENIDLLATALVAAQATLKSPPKNLTNPFFNSKYAGLPECCDAVREVYRQNGLAVVQGGGEHAEALGNSDGGDLRVAITVETRIIHESGQWIESSLPVVLSKLDPQMTCAAFSYGRRNLLNALVFTAPDDDDDANAATYSTADFPKAEPVAPQARASTGGGGGGGRKASDKQLSFVRSLADRAGVPPELASEVEAWLNGPDECYSHDASRLIDMLQDAPKKPAAPAPRPTNTIDEDDDLDF